MPKEEETLDQTEEEVQDKDQTPEEVQEESGENKSEEVDSERDYGRLTDELDGDFTVDQVKDLVEKGTRFEEEFMPEFTKRSQKLREYEDGAGQNETGYGKQEEQGKEDSGYSDPLAASTSEDQAIVDAIANRASEKTKTEIQDMRVEMELMKLRRTVGDKLDDRTEKQVLTYAAQNGIPSLEQAYKAMGYDGLQSRLKKSDQAIEESKKKTGKTTGGGAIKEKGTFFKPYDRKKDKNKTDADFWAETRTEWNRRNKG